MENRVLQNCAVWLFLFLIGIVSIQSDNRFLASLLIIVFVSIPVYVNNLLILPQFYKRRALLGVGLFLFNAFACSFISVMVLVYDSDNFEWRMFYNLYGIAILFLFFSTATKLAADRIRSRSNEREAELNLLKGQLNPHFLFNTMNNLYGLSVIKSDQLPALMLKLSDLLRYGLYETRDPFVPVEKEIQYLSNYIALEKIRLEEKVEVKFEVIGETLKWQIAPMLLIVFLENAFKHLGSSNGEECVHVTLELTEETIKFTCVNSKIDADVSPRDHSGIGLENVKSRLKLIYPVKHLLKINQNEHSFEVTLEIKK